MKRLSLSVRLILVTVWLSLIPPVLFAQPDKDQPDLTIDAKMRTEVLSGVMKNLNESYVFPETATRMEQALRDRIARNEYNGITSAKQLAETLTRDLQEVSKDKHLRVAYSHEPRPVQTREEEPSPEERERFLTFARSVNFGFEKVERLEGNVGYLDLQGFIPAEAAADTAAAAMNFLANADALIIDLRKNGGGDPAQVAFISSYLFNPGEPVHLNSLYWRPRDFTHQWWTLPYVPGKRLGKDKPVYVLTANYTFSAAEEFAYNLQNLKRATIVGETTGGGAHPGGVRQINEHFTVWVPSGRAINPISGKNWEGTGVQPDVPVEAEKALKTAHVEALRKLIAGEKDEQRKQRLEQILTKTEKKLSVAPGSERSQIPSE
jgi:retinol-binding protein 3